MTKMLKDLAEVVAYAWRKDGMRGWALGHNPPTSNMIDFDKYEVRELTFRTHHAEIAQNAEASYHLGEILAVLNGDGGHYLAEHGVKDSSDRAINKIADLIIECDKNAETAKRLEAAERDAARYRWLSDNCQECPDAMGMGGQLYFGTYSGMDGIDFAIDTAMLAASKENGM